MSGDMIRRLCGKLSGLLESDPMNDDTFVAKVEETVIEETINAYRVEKLADGRVRITAGGTVSLGATYFEALEQYAQIEQARISKESEHLRNDHRESIYDGCIPLKSFDSSGFTPKEILDHVTMQPIEHVMEDIDADV